MGLYVIMCSDKPQSLDLRLATRPDHLEFLAALPNVKVAGPFLDPQGNMVGSMLVIEADSLDDARAIAADDPYAKAGLFQMSEIRPWRQTAGCATL